MKRNPGNVKGVHLVGVCGMGMAGLAGLLKEAGYRVSGSDQSFEPPMGPLVRGLDIEIHEGYGAENIADDIELAVIGNAVSRDHPEAREIMSRAIAYTSFPESAYRFFFAPCARRLVVSGTHGKTTTTALLSWILERCGLDPTYLVGGILTNTRKNYRLGAGDVCVVEGDEYDSAFFDKRPKFLHYSPTLLIVTSLELDHTDIYPDVEALKRAFTELVNSLEEDTTVLWNPNYAELCDVMEAAPPMIRSIPMFRRESWQIQRLPERGGFVIMHEGRKFAEGKTSLMGDYNLDNILFSFAAAKLLEIETESIISAIEEFKGVKRRQEVVGEIEGVTIIDDFAHHPTAVEKTIRAVREHFRGRRIVAVFEPRTSSSRTRIFEEKFARALSAADVVIIAPVSQPERVPPENRFRPNVVCKAIRDSGKQASAAESPEQILQELSKVLRPKDAVLFMSSGNFYDLPVRTIDVLKATNDHTVSRKTEL